MPEPYRASPFLGKARLKLTLSQDLLLTHHFRKMIVSPADSSSASSSCPSTPRWRPPSHPHGKPRQKRHHNKSRDGCLTCRARRVKCDEQRPSCKACLKRALTCHYADPTSDLQVVKAPSSPLSQAQCDLTFVSFFTENTLDLLSFAPDSFPDSHIKLACQTFPENCHTRFVKFWNSLVLPMAYTEPRIMELISMFAKRHWLALTDSPSEATEYPRMLGVMSRIIDSHPPDVIIIGAMIFFAYERLISAASGDEPTDQNHIHYNAVVNMLPRTSEAAVDFILPILNVTWKLHIFHPDTTSEELIQVPDRFEDSTQARQCFSDVLQTANMRHSLERWLMAALRYYKEVKGKNWHESSATLTMLTEARYLRTALDLQFDEPRTRGQFEPKSRTSSTTPSSVSP